MAMPPMQGQPIEQVQPETQQEPNPTEGRAMIEQALAADESEASPEEQEEYERVAEMLQTFLYEEDQTSKGIVDQINIEDKIGSTVQAILLLITEIDKAADIDDVVMEPIAEDATEGVIELAEAKYGMEYTEQEVEAVWVNVFTGILRMYENAEREEAEGVEAEEAMNAAQGTGQQQANPEQQAGGFLPPMSPAGG